jgi:CRISPR-associated protein (TIGR03985 family)
MENGYPSFYISEAITNSPSKKRITMTISINRPSIELLEFLIPNMRISQKVGLAKAVKLWVLLYWLYETQHSLPNLFRSRDLHQLAIIEKNLTAIFSELPQESLHQISFQSWLFTSEDTDELKDWKGKLVQTKGYSPEGLNRLLEKPLFDFTATKDQGQRNIFNYLQNLVEIRCLEKTPESTYHTVEQLPDELVKQTNRASLTENLFTPDIETLFELLNQSQRFFMELDYVVSKYSLDPIVDWLDCLQNIWQLNPIPPVIITYNSASLATENELIIYPICVAYSQRAPYLSGYGQTPNSPQGDNFYNFRLDRIENMKRLEWDDASIPAILRDEYERNTLPSLETVREKLNDVWGFDFYQNAATLLLRFRRDFHDRYILDSFRHNTFKEINLRKMSTIFRSLQCSPEEQKQIQSRIAQYPQDAYYEAKYRENDNNIIMRLRAWGSNVEVLWPPQLRENIAEDLDLAHQNYNNLRYEHNTSSYPAI